jgi:hypothetical protein
MTVVRRRLWSRAGEVGHAAQAPTLSEQLFDHEPNTPIHGEILGHDVAGRAEPFAPGRAASASRSSSDRGERPVSRWTVPVTWAA